MSDDTTDQTSLNVWNYGRVQTEIALLTAKIVALKGEIDSLDGNQKSLVDKHEEFEGRWLELRIHLVEIQSFLDDRKAARDIAENLKLKRSRLWLDAWHWMRIIFVGAVALVAVDMIRMGILEWRTTSTITQPAR